MNSSDLAQRLQDVGLPYPEIEDYVQLRSTKIQLDKARQEVEKAYENLSKCHLDNMTYAKAQLDHARQKEKDCFEDFEEPHNHVVAILSRLIRANNSTGTYSTDELEYRSSLGPIPRVRTRRTRAPTRATADSSRRVTKSTRNRATAPAPGSAEEELAYPGAFALARRALNDAPFRALMGAVAAGHASDRQLRAVREVMDELEVTLDGNIIETVRLGYNKQETASDD
jgi:hypothetical protein